MSAVLRWLLVGAALCGAAIGASLDEERRASQEMEILEWDLEAEDNGCDNLQTALWTFLTDAGDASAQERVDSIVSYASLQKEVAFKSKEFLRKDFRSGELKRKAQILSNPGMALLSEGDVKMGAEFMVAAKQRQRAASNFSKAFVTTKEESGLESLWSEWQQNLKPTNDNSYQGFLKLADQSASLNNERNLEQLWETQSEWMGGYSRAQKLWKEIEPLYLKFHAYVRRRLQKIYPEVPDPIPVHLLGSPEGVDWSGIAQAALLQEEIMKNLESSIAQQSTVELYRKAQNMSTNMGLPDLGRSFWDSSKFKEQCPSEIVVACSDEGVRVVTCNSTPSWPAYLDAHEKIFQGSYYNLAGRTNSYIFRHGNRFSGIAAAVSDLGSLLAVANVVEAGLLARDASDPLGQAVNLRMLVALRTLPRLPYLLGVDLCRLRDAPFPPTHPSCWQDRTKLQRVAKPTSLADENVYDLFSDRAVTSNDPHLSEFAGAILQFQLYEYLAKTSGLGRRDLFQIGIGKMEINDDFRLVLKAGLTKPWPELLLDLNITEVSTAALLKFFKPIMSVLDDMAPVSEIPDYDLETDSLPSSPSPSLVTSRSRQLHTPKPWSPQAEASSRRPSALSTTEGGVGEEETSTEGGLSELAPEEPNRSQPTAYIAIGGILIGLLIVVASIFIVNRRRKSSSSRPEIRKTSNGHIYDPVRRSVGRPASFSPEVAKRLSENGVTPPLPVFSTFRNSLSSPDDCESPETIILESPETIIVEATLTTSCD